MQIILKALPQPLMLINWFYNMFSITFTSAKNSHRIQKQEIRRDCEIKFDRICEGDSVQDVDTLYGH